MSTTTENARVISERRDIASLISNEDEPDLDRFLTERDPLVDESGRREWFRAAGGDMDTLSIGGYSALSLAVGQQNTACAERQIAHGARVGGVVGESMSPLHHALYGRSADNVRLLLENGAGPYAIVRKMPRLEMRETFENFVGDIPL